jgi:hypothetical protein
MLHKAIAVIGIMALGYFSTKSFLKNEEITEQIKQAKEIEYTIEKANLERKYTNNGEISKGILSQNTNLSSLLEDNVSIKEKEIINNLQKAIKIAIIDKNIANPSCNDLANTNQISLSDCNFIKDRENNFVQIDSNGTTIKNENIAKIINNKNYFSEKNQNSDDTYFVSSFNKSQMSADLVKIEKELNSSKELEDIIKESDDVDALIEIGKAVTLRADNENVKMIDLKRIITINNKIEEINNRSDADKIDSYYKINEDGASTTSVQKLETMRNDFKDRFDELSSKYSN